MPEPAMPETSQSAATPSPPPPQNLKIRYGNSEAAMGDEIVISVVAIDFGGSPLRDRVTFVIGGRRIPSKTYSLADVGKVCEAGDYEVRLTGADAIYAQFAVSRR